ncbi:hypothetical protein B0H13DRAFT_1860682 [Mycena leptocephala]|nr:hypothetical protein B0H13DRAFT_1860682 [Mycena leptocephala]
MSSPAPRWSVNAAPTQLSVYNVNMRPLLPKAESLNHIPTLLELGIQLRRDSVSPICRGPDKTLKGKLSTAKPKAHRQDENASPPEQEALKANRRSTDNGHGDNESLRPRSPHSMCMERWIEEAFALAVKGYVENWKLQRDVLKMIPIVIQPTLYQKQSIGKVFARILVCTEIREHARDARYMEKFKLINHGCWESWRRGVKRLSK